MKGVIAVGLKGKKVLARVIQPKLHQPKMGNISLSAECCSHNERKISFRWVFSHALPTMAGREYTTRVKAIMTNGDSHEMEELDLAIDHYMPQCCRI
eukprot:scaffold11678_cov92-Amphora_coffeaeformis.AAC.1